MTLREKQSIFVVMVSDLIRYANVLGYDLTFGEAWRSPEEAARLAKAGAGIKASLHCQRLAIDLNLFKDGTYLRATNDHLTLGSWWEEQSRPPDIVCCWGGRHGDGNHYSLAHGGKR